MLATNTNYTRKKMKLTTFRGHSTDEFNCFHIRDFKENDSLILSLKGGERVKAVVSSVDLSSNLLTVKTASGELTTDIESVVFLDDYKRGWLG